MPIAIIDALEMVGIDDEERHGAAVIPSMLPRLGSRILEGPAIMEARQGVGHRKTLQLHLGGFPATQFAPEQERQVIVRPQSRDTMLPITSALTRHSASTVFVERRHSGSAAGCRSG